MTKRRFELSSGPSNKFWEVTSTRAGYTVTWGRIGTVGQSKTKKTSGGILGSVRMADRRGARLR